MAPHESDRFFDWAYTQIVFRKSRVECLSQDDGDECDGERIIRGTFLINGGPEQNILCGEYVYDFLEFAFNDFDYDTRSDGEEKIVPGWQLTWSYINTSVHTLRLTEEQQALVEDLFQQIKKDRNEDASP